MNVRITARSRDWNARCNGREEHRRVMLPTGESGWAVELGENVEGYWAFREGAFRASDRHCRETVEVPVGTIVVDFERYFRGGVPQGKAVVTTGVVTTEGVDWENGPTFRRSKDGVVVRIDGVERGV